MTLRDLYELEKIHMDATERAQQQVMEEAAKNLESWVMEATVSLKIDMSDLVQLRDDDPCVIHYCCYEKCSDDCTGSEAHNYKPCRYPREYCSICCRAHDPGDEDRRGA